MKRFIFIIVLIFLIIFPYIIKAQNTSQTDELQKKIADYENKLAEIRKQKNTLATQIQLMDTQIYLTTLKIQETEQKIESTQKEIELLDSKIENLDFDLNNLLKTFIAKVNNDYKKRNLSLFSLILEANNFSDFFRKIKYLQSARESNKNLILKVQQAKANYQEQKILREEKTIYLENLKVTLNSQKSELNNQKIAKQRLLTETNNDELTYQRLLSQARAQLAGFSNFVANQGGASILTNQTSCDDWGCYYNQRDSQWGKNSLNGTQYTLAGEGCLVTSMAMIYTHYGYKNINPQTINSNPNNFASYNPAYLMYRITANNITLIREKIYDISTSNIDNELSANKPVVVGVSYNGCPSYNNYNKDLHFVVIISGSNGNYKMHDPFIPNGHNISFNDHYSITNICELYRVTL